MGRNQRYAEACPNSAARARLLGRIKSIYRRCLAPKCRAYSRYGALGIGVHKEWIKDRAIFLKYLTSLPGWDNPALDIDRIDNSLGYEPGNLRFATRLVNNRNRRTSTGGVTFVRRTGKWQAQAYESGKYRYIGQFATKEQAVAAVEKVKAN